MPNNKETILKIKNNAGNYIAIYPKTTRNQVMGWNIGELKGPYILDLKANAWVRNKQVLALDGISDKDILDCVQVLKGTQEQMIAQKAAYEKLSHIAGVQSLNNQIMFTCDEVPDVDIQVQVWWTV